MDCIVHGVTKGRTQLSEFHFHFPEFHWGESTTHFLQWYYTFMLMIFPVLFSNCPLLSLTPQSEPIIDNHLVFWSLREYRKNGCTCPNPCSDSKYGRTVHLQNKDNPRLINIPPRDSDEWKNEYNNRTSSERCNKREKIDYKYEDGNHRSTRNWYCRLYCIMMCQHLDAWDSPYESELKQLLIKAA